mmetsp:Transcript_17236/g.35505  ORF Transcript_17236/g.35505 Transcript_17236/m.35505 type:complete len:282 (-) Transcript_17236:804-1649(-)
MGITSSIVLRGGLDLPLFFVCLLAASSVCLKTKPQTSLMNLSSLGRRSIAEDILRMHGAMRVTSDISSSLHVCLRISLEISLGMASSLSSLNLWFALSSSISALVPMCFFRALTSADSWAASTAAYSFRSSSSILLSDALYCFTVGLDCSSRRRLVDSSCADLSCSLVSLSLSSSFESFLAKLCSLLTSNLFSFSCSLNLSVILSIVSSTTPAYPSSSFLTTPFSLSLRASLRALTSPLSCIISSSMRSLWASYMPITSRALESEGEPLRADRLWRVLKTS